MGRRRSGRHRSVARLSALQPPISSRYHCRPSPCDRLSRPRTTTTAPSHPRPLGRRCAQPERPRWQRDPGQTQGGSRVHLLIARRRKHPTRPLRPRRGYPAARHPGLPSVPPTCRGVPRLRNEGNGCASRPAQIRQVRAGASLRGVERRFLAYTFPSRSPHPRRLAVPTRHGFVGAACHPSRHLPRQAAPSYAVLLRQEQRCRSFTSTHSTSASRRTGRMTHTGRPSWFRNRIAHGRTTALAYLVAVSRMAAASLTTSSSAPAAAVRAASAAWAAAVVPRSRPAAAASAVS